MRLTRFAPCSESTPNMAKAEMFVPEPVETEVTLTLSLAEARWLLAVTAHVNGCSSDANHDVSIWDALTNAGISMSAAEREEALRHYETDYGIFQGVKH